MSEPDVTPLSTIELVHQLKDGLIARAQGEDFFGGDQEYRVLRERLRVKPDVYSRLPVFVRTCSDLSQFWAFIKPKYSSYKERREFLWQSFSPVIGYLETNSGGPGADSIATSLAKFDSDSVEDVWQKALNRLPNDPDGAITAARALLETVCKHILDDCNIEYRRDEDLPQLWRLVAKQLNLTPEQHDEEIFRSILGNCQSVVNNLAAIRNSAGDAHGGGRSRVKPKPRHAALAVNLAGTMAAFLVSTWNERQPKAVS